MPGEALEYHPQPGRSLYLHTVRGALTLNGQSLATGDAASIVDEGPIALESSADTEVLLFDLPAEH
jgi:redox-sensitive bicupin YhaK (pirin superfamily)